MNKHKQANNKTEKPILVKSQEKHSQLRQKRAECIKLIHIQALSTHKNGLTHILMILQCKNVVHNKFERTCSNQNNVD